MDIKLNAAAASAAHKLSAIGGTVYVVGGAVRDTILGIEPKDIDLLVTGVSHDVINRHPHFWETGEHFGVYRHREGDSEVEVALPRVEGSTGPGHKDFAVTISSTLPIDADLGRRDFTMNAMAYNIDTGELIDPFGGEADARGGLVRSVFDGTFEADPLRILRAFVLVSRYDADLTVRTAEEIEKTATLLRELPAERIQAELDKIFSGDHPDRAMINMQAVSVLKFIFPEVANSWDYDQNNPHHSRILGRHHVETLRHVASITDDPDIRLAGFLHDIGKPDSAWVDPVTGMNHFYCKKVTDPSWPWPVGFFLGHDHELVGADMAAVRLHTLKYPAARVNRIVYLIENHMWAPFTTERGARRFLNKHGESLAYDLLNLRFGDQHGKTEYPGREGHDLNTQRELLDLVTSEAQPTKTADLAINGHDLIEAGVITPGPEMGALIAYLTDKVVDDPSLNSDYQLMRIAAIWVDNPDYRENL